MKKFLCTVIALSFFLLSACGEEVIKPNESGVDTSVENSDQSETTSTEVTESTSDGEYSFESSEQPFSEESSDEDVVYSGDYGYTLVNTVAMICAYKGKDTEITLPSELDGYTVTAVTDEAFSGNTSIKRITLSDTVVNVGEGAFVGCSSLEYVFIGSSVAVLHSGAFDGCKALKEIDIPDTVKSIGSFAFTGCEKIDTVVIPESVTKIGECAFAGMSALERAVIPDSVKDIGKNAFHECEKLVIECSVGSAAEKYANENSISCLEG